MANERAQCQYRLFVLIRLTMLEHFNFNIICRMPWKPTILITFNPYKLGRFLFKRNRIMFVLQRSTRIPFDIIMFLLGLWVRSNTLSWLCVCMWCYEIAKIGWVGAIEKVIKRKILHSNEDEFKRKLKTIMRMPNPASNPDKLRDNWIWNMLFIRLRIWIGNDTAVSRLHLVQNDEQKSSSCCRE